MIASKVGCVMIVEPNVDFLAGNKGTHHREARTHLFIKFAKSVGCCLWGKALVLPANN